MNKTVEVKTEAAVMRERYIALRTALCDLLCELRITPASLRVMSHGFSPDYPGATDPGSGKSVNGTYPKVQLSAVVAKKLRNFALENATAMEYGTTTGWETVDLSYKENTDEKSD